MNQNHLKSTVVDLQQFRRRRRQNDVLLAGLGLLAFVLFVYIMGTA